MVVMVVAAVLLLLPPSTGPPPFAIRGGIRLVGLAIFVVVVVVVIVVFAIVLWGVSVGVAPCPRDTTVVGCGGRGEEARSFRVPHNGGQRGRGGGGGGRSFHLLFST